MSKEQVRKITLGDIRILNMDIEKLKTIDEWKQRVKKFAVQYNLTDREAIDIANGHFNIK